VRSDHLTYKRQKRRQRVFGGEAAVFDALVKEFVKRRHGSSGAWEPASKCVGPG